MYIISKFTDYYDGAVGMGIDKSIVYERHTKGIFIPSYIGDVIDPRDGWKQTFTHIWGGWNDPIPKNKMNTTTIVIGFCGKLYVGIKYTKQIYTIQLYRG